MSGIFPIVQPEAAAEPRRLPLCKEAAWDFEKGTTVFSGGKPQVVSGAEAVKILIPSASCGVYVAGTEECRLDKYISQAVDLAAKELGL